MNVLLLCESYGGGVKTYIDTIVENESKFKNIKLTVFISSKRLEVNEYINPSYIIDDNLSYGKSVTKLILSLRKLHQIIKKNNIDIVHANSTFAGALIYIYSKFNNSTSYYYTPHGYYSFKKMNKLKNKLVQYFERKINKNALKVIHVSNGEQFRAIKDRLVAPSSSIVINNGVRNPNFHYHGQYKNDKNLNIINLARVDEQKNPFLFIEIAKRIVEYNDNVNFIWAGNGKLLDEARKKIIELGVQEKVKFIGFCKETQEFLEKGDIYLSTSFYEGLPFSVLEAMSFGIPLVLSNVVGHNDIIPPKYKSNYYSINNIDEVVSILQYLIMHDEVRDGMRRVFYSYFNENFDVDKMLQSLLEVYSTKVKQ